MNLGLRDHKSATLRIATPECIPEEMRERVREILSVHSTNPRKSHATLLMHQVCAEADCAGILLILQPHKFDEGMPDEKLEDWYEKFGFVRIQTDPVVLMARQVQPRVVLQ